MQAIIIKAHMRLPLVTKQVDTANLAKQLLLVIVLVVTVKTVAQLLLVNTLVNTGKVITVLLLVLLLDKITPYLETILQPTQVFLVDLQFKMQVMLETLLSVLQMLV